MSKKIKKSKKTPKVDQVTSFDVGWNAEQTMAEYICNNIKGEYQEDLDDAFFGALSGLVERLGRFYPKEFLLDYIDGMPGLNEQEHVCDDCKAEQEALNNTPVHKGTVH